MLNSVAEQLASLPQLSKTGLCTLWKELFQQQPPTRLRRDVLVPILAYRVQELAFGGVSPSSRRRLRQMARELKEDRAAIGRSSTLSSIKPGTRLIRQWGDQTHIVTVKQEGYEYRGSHYRSLSVIARRIAGTRWSGPLFFGLPRNKTSRPMEKK